MFDILQDAAEVKKGDSYHALYKQNKLKGGSFKDRL